MRLRTASLAIALAAAGLSTPAFAQSAGDWTVAIGAHQVNPKSGNGTLTGGLKLDIGSDVKPTIAFEYFVRDNLGLEVLAAWPFQHDINIAGLGKVGSTKHLPPTFSVQYHFNPQGKIRPLLGVGVNYTTFFDEKTSGALSGAKLQLGDSWGLAVHAGVDFALSERSAIRVDARWMNIKSKVKVNGADMGDAKIDPLVYGAAYVIKF